MKLKRSSSDTHNRSDLKVDTDSGMFFTADCEHCVGHPKVLNRKKKRVLYSTEPSHTSQLHTPSDGTQFKHPAGAARLSPDQAFVTQLWFGLLALPYSRRKTLNSHPRHR